MTVTGPDQALNVPSVSILPKLIFIVVKEVKYLDKFREVLFQRIPVEGDSYILVPP